MRLSFLTHLLDSVTALARPWRIIVLGSASVLPGQPQLGDAGQPLELSLDADLLRALLRLGILELPILRPHSQQTPLGEKEAATAGRAIPHPHDLPPHPDRRDLRHGAALEPCPRIGQHAPSTAPAPILARAQL